MMKCSKNSIAVFKGETLFTGAANLLPFLIFLFSFLLFFNTIFNGYNLDDELVTINHPLTSQGLSDVKRIFTSPFYSDNFGYNYDYRPMTLLSFAIENQFFGDSPKISHFFNIILFSFICVLLYLCLKKLFYSAKAPLSLVTVLLYASHPIHTEVVASIKGRDELLSLFFSLLSLYWFIKYVNNSFTKAFLVGSLLFLLSLLSKISCLSFSIAIPITLLLLNKCSNRKHLLIISAFLSILAMFLVNLNLPLKALFITASMATVSVVHFICKHIQSKSFEGFQAVSNKLSAFNQVAKDINKGANFTKLQKSGFIHFWLFNICITLIFIAPYLLSRNDLMIGNILFLISLVYALFLASGWRQVFLLAVCLGVSLYSFIVTDIYFNFSLALAIFAAVFNFLLYPQKKGFYIFFIILILASFEYAAFHSFQFVFPLVFLIGIVIPKLRFVYKYGRWVIAIIPVLSILSFPFTGSLENVPAIVIICCFILTSRLYDLGYSRRNINFFFFAIFALIILSESLYISVQGRESVAEKVYFNTSRYIDPNTIVLATNVITTDAKDVALALNKTGTKPVTGFIYNRPLDFVEAPVQISSKFSVRFATGLDILFRYFKLLWVPHPLCYYYGYKIIDVKYFNSATVIISLILHLLIAITGVLSIKKNPVISWAIGFYLITIAPFSNILQTIPGGLGERYLVVPSIGFCVIIAWCVAVGVPRILKRVFTSTNLISSLIIVSVILLYSFATIIRNFQWKDKLTLMRHDIVNINNSAQAHNLLAFALMAKSIEIKVSRQEQVALQQEAIQHFRKALDIYPKFFNVAFDLGRAYEQLNMPDSAVVAYKKALQLNPTYYQIHLNLSNLLINTGHPVEAIPLLETFIKNSPEEYVGYEKLSFAYYRLGRYSESIATNKMALMALPNEAAAYINIGRVFKAMQQPDSARLYLNEGLKIAPGNPDATNLLNSLGNSR
ncbi:MAG: tetratricopeptide repeat protein [Chitinophagales bacterium]